MNEQNTLTLISYLSFRLGDEIFAANVGKVLEILEVPKITKVPKSPAFMTGVINLRGNVLPVIDARMKFGMPPIEITVSTCIIVLDIQIDKEALKVGALVDAVQEVFEIEDNEISPSPSIGNKYKSEFLEGMGKVGDDFIMILDVNKVFTADELTVLKETIV